MVTEIQRQPGNDRHGYRGYIASRPIAGNRTPQHVQNLVVRDYAARNGLTFLLSATEFAMPGCYLVLEGVMNELDACEGAIIYSLFMLPRNPVARRAIYDRILRSDAVMYAAVEDYRIADPRDVKRVEEIWRISEVLENAATGL